GAMAVMTSYNLVNDEWCGESNNIINDLLRDKLRFKWLVMTDWWSVYDGEKVVKSGQDLEMPRAVALEDVKTLLKNKKVTEDEIDRMAKSVLRTCIAMNFYDKSIKQPEFLDKYPEHVNVALQSAREGIVLLKNNGILPVDKNKSGNILLTGKYINNIARGGGAAKVEGYDTIILSDALTKEFGGNITYLENPDIDQIKEADIVLLTIGTYDSEGWDRPFALPEEEENKIIEVLDNNENTIVIVISGSGIQMTNWKDKAAAILYAWYGGQAGNVALVEILSGKTNPSGKLPITIEKRFEDSPGYGYLPEGEKLYKDWAKNEKEHPIWDLEYKEGIFIGYRWYEEKNIEPLFPFGYGLSYTTFKYSNLKVSHKKFFIKDTIQVSFIIKNAGKVKGKEIAQLYINDPESTHPRPVKELKEFIKVDLLPGEAKKVILYLDKNDFSYWNPDMKNWFAERGVFNILIGSSLNEIKLSAEIILE
ncbi:MAG: glycoside hydrolase family 3 C-terminal domain-containing protein, partial [Bacteroidales bacterium]|nr:glycoside hydrolase family 3 C-terminal domain-containing protein [Bacteroidales bacterium]